MTPAAITPAGRGSAKNKAAVSAPPGHRRTMRQQQAPKVARRVSGPLAGRAAVAGRTAVSGAAAAGALAPQPRAQPLPRPEPQPRRRSQPRPQRNRRRAASRSASAPLGARALAFVRALPDRALLDRIVRGRAWIPLLGVMLVGIVAMQVEVLKLGASIGRSIQLGATLQSRNEALRESVATLEDGQRILRLAGAMGMFTPAPDGVGFLSARSAGNVQPAIANIHVPDSQAFLALTSTNGAVATGPSTTLTATGSSQPSTSQQSAVSASQAQPASQAQAPSQTQTQTPSQAQAPSQTQTPSQAQSPSQAQAPAQATAPATTASNGQTAGTNGATAPTQVAPTQNSSTQTNAPSSGGAALPPGG